MKKLLFLCLFLLVPGLLLAQGFSRSFHVWPNCGTLDSLTFKADSMIAPQLIVDSVLVQVSRDTLRRHISATKVGFAGVKSTASAAFGSMMIASGPYGLTGAKVIYNSGDSVLRVNVTPTNTENDSVCTIVFRQAAFSPTLFWKGAGRIASVFHPPGTEIVRWVDSTLMLLSNQCYADTGVYVLSTNVVTEAPFYGGSASAMTAGDIVGMPFEFTVPSTPFLSLSGALLIDSTRQTGTFAVIVADTAFAYIAQNGAFNVAWPSQRHILAVYPVTSTTNIGGANPGGTTYYSNAIYPLIKYGSTASGTDPYNSWLTPGKKLYGAMMTLGTPTYQGITSLILKLYFDTLPR